MNSTFSGVRPRGECSIAALFSRLLRRQDQLVRISSATSLTDAANLKNLTLAPKFIRTNDRGWHRAYSQPIAAFHVHSMPQAVAIYSSP